MDYFAECFQRKDAKNAKAAKVDENECSKAIDKLAAIHEVQLLTYLRFANKRLGLVLNFHVPKMRDGVRPVVNNL
jgi:hypothetical protein